MFTTDALGVRSMVMAVDFAKADDQVFEEIKKKISTLRVSVLGESALPFSRF